SSSSGLRSRLVNSTSFSSEERERMNRQLRTCLLVLATAIALTRIGRAVQFQLIDASIADIHGAYKAHILRPQQLVNMYLERIDMLDRSTVGQPLHGGTGNQPLNSYMHVNEHALDDARRLDPDDQGDDEGGSFSDDDMPLFGIPVILKDNVATR